MITFIEGILEEKCPDFVVVNANGVGYHIAISITTYDALPDLKSKIKVYTYLHIRDDGHFLYGFAERYERTFFEDLISVSGIGPASALTILSGMNPTGISEAIINSDIKKLSTIKGIGKKTAERMIVELRDKISAVCISNPTTKHPDFDRETADAAQALVSLGYKSTEALNAIRNIKQTCNTTATVNELVKLALKQLNKE